MSKSTVESSLRLGSERVQGRVSACRLVVHVHINQSSALPATAGVGIGVGDRECSVSPSVCLRVTWNLLLGFAEWIGDDGDNEGEEVEQTKFGQRWVVVNSTSQRSSAT
jgi:hypothetical protein